MKQLTKDDLHQFADRMEEHFRFLVESTEGAYEDSTNFNTILELTMQVIGGELYETYGEQAVEDIIRWMRNGVRNEKRAERMR